MDRDPTSQPAEKDTREHIAGFEELPETKKELMKLKHHSEKSTGSEKADASEEILEKSDN